MKSWFRCRLFRFHKIRLVLSTIWPCENRSLPMLLLLRLLLALAAAPCAVWLAFGMMWRSLLFMIFNIRGFICFFDWYVLSYSFAFWSWWAWAFESWRLFNWGTFSSRALACTLTPSFSYRFSSLSLLRLVHLCQINWVFFWFWLFQKFFSLLDGGIHSRGSLQFLFFWNFRQFRWTIYLIVSFP